MENPEFTDITVYIPLIFIAAVSLYRYLRYQYLTQKREARNRSIAEQHTRMTPSKDSHVLF